MKPSVSVIVPTLNCDKALKVCLESVKKQDYPGKVEIVIADGGSTDKTLEVARKFTNKIFKNKLKTGEAGKSVGVKKAKNDIIALVDSDNILPSKDWLKKMVKPFEEKDIIASEPIRFTYRKSDKAMTRYWALTGVNDPLCIFLGNYDRFSVLTGKWTGMPHEEEKRDGYIKVRFAPDKMPTIGANGFMIRRNLLKGVGDYLFDIDILHEVMEKGSWIAKVDAGIIHIYSESSSIFYRKQKRRIRDYSYYTYIGARKYPWKGMRKKGVLKFALYSVTVLPLVVQSLRGWFKKRDSAWFYHVPACLITLYVYSVGSIRSRFSVKEMSREGWKQ